jgi:hypothetical protein
MIMKKLLPLFIACFLILSAGSAFAVPWNWDLTPVNASARIGLTDSPIVHFDDKIGAISINGDTTITQSLGGDGKLNNGDTFTESGQLEIINKDTSAISFSDPTVTTQYHVYVDFQNLTGQITDYNAGTTTPGATTLANYGTNLADDSYKLAFAPGLGSITLYLDDNTDPTDGTLATLADYTLVTAEGTSPELVAGSSVEGQFGLVTGFTSVYPGVWSFDDGTKFEDWMATYGIPSIFLSSFNLGATVNAISTSGSDLSFNVFNHGDFRVSAVPEPGTLMLLGLGLLGIAGVSRKRFLNK